jgi:hypothetical protein
VPIALAERCRLPMSGDGDKRWQFSHSRLKPRAARPDLSKVATPAVAIKRSSSWAWWVTMAILVPLNWSFDAQAGSPRRLLLLVAASMLVAALVVAPHEFGHALAARSFGCQIREIRIGIRGARRDRRLRLPGFPIVFGRPRSGTAGHVGYSPALPTGRAIVVLLAGPALGTVALACAVAVVGSSSTTLRHALYLVMVGHLTLNLVPDKGASGISDGNRVWALLRRRKSADHVEVAVAFPTVEDVRAAHAASNGGDCAPILRMLDDGLRRPQVDAARRLEMLRHRAIHRYRAGSFLQAAQDHGQLDGGSQGWADSILAAVLFGQLDASDPVVARAREIVEFVAAGDSSLAVRHSLAVLRLLDGRPQEAWSVADPDGIQALEPPERAAVIAVRALAAPDAETRKALCDELAAETPWSPWMALALKAVSHQPVEMMGAEKRR